MGPHFFKCGNIGEFVRLWGNLLGFNGAALFQVWKVRVADINKQSGETLQWGRTFSSVERFPIVFLAGAGWICFNGAALFQVWKEKKIKIMLASAAGFNGAALFQVWKVFRLVLRSFFD